MNQPLDPRLVPAYHITGIANISSIVTRGGLFSDAQMAGANHNIGYDHIKQRRLTEIQVTCCPNAPFVGQFVPFYFSARSVMLYVVNQGKTGRPPGCQNGIVHLVCRVSTLANLGREWAISNGNAGAYHAVFRKDLAWLNELEWPAIRATSWSGMTHHKQAEFLVMDFVPWEAVELIGCYDDAAVGAVQLALRDAGAGHVPEVAVKRGWYY